MLAPAHPSGRMRQWSVVGRELVAMKKSGVRRPKQRPPRLRTMIPDRGLLFVTSMALTVYCAQGQRLRHITDIAHLHRIAIA